MVNDFFAYYVYFYVLCIIFMYYVYFTVNTVFAPKGQDKLLPIQKTLRAASHR